MNNFEKKMKQKDSYEYHRLMNERIIVLMLGFQIKRGEKVIHVLWVVLMDRIEDIVK